MLLRNYQWPLFFGLILSARFILFYIVIIIQFESFIYSYYSFSFFWYLKKKNLFLVGIKAFPYQLTNKSWLAFQIYYTCCTLAGIGNFDRMVWINLHYFLHFMESTQLSLRLAEGFSDLDGPEGIRTRFQFSGWNLDSQTNIFYNFHLLICNLYKTI